jgi:hypothetical protein
MADVISPDSPFKEEARLFFEQSGIKERTDDILGPFSDMECSFARIAGGIALLGVAFADGIDGGRVLVFP